MSSRANKLPPVTAHSGGSDQSSQESLGSAANDVLNSIEPHELDSSVGIYERLASIRCHLLESDIWISIAVYAVLVALVFFVV